MTHRFTSLALAVGLLASLPSSAFGAGWAVIVNGDDVPLHHRNVATALDAIESRDWPGARVRLLGAADQETLNRLEAPVAPATREAIVDLFHEIDRTSAPDEPVLLYLTGHSTRFLGSVSVHLEGPNVGQKALEKMLSELRGRDLVMVVDVCYAGALLDLEYDGRLVVVSATDDDHTVLCAAFNRPFWSAVAYDGSDRNGDGRLLLSEILETTFAAIPPSEAEDAPRPAYRGDPGWYSFGKTASARLAESASAPARTASAEDLDAASSLAAAAAAGTRR